MKHSLAIAFHYTMPPSRCDTSHHSGWMTKNISDTTKKQTGNTTTGFESKTFRRFYSGIDRFFISELDSKTFEARKKQGKQRLQIGHRWFEFVTSVHLTVRAPNLRFAPEDDIFSFFSKGSRCSCPDAGPSACGFRRSRPERPGSGRAHAQP